MTSEFLFTGEGESHGEEAVIGFELPGIPTMKIPSAIRRKVVYPTLGLDVELGCELINSRLEAKTITIQSSDGGLATSMFTQLRLPLILRRIALDSISNVDFYSGDIEEIDPVLLREDRMVAQIYALEYASWGNPRDTLMRLLGWSRTNTNLHLRRISKDFPLPGPHSKHRQKGMHADSNVVREG